MKQKNTYIIVNPCEGNEEYAKRVEQLLIKVAVRALKKEALEQCQQQKKSA